MKPLIAAVLFLFSTATFAGEVIVMVHTYHLIALRHENLSALNGNTSGVLCISAHLVAGTYANSIRRRSAVLGYATRAEKFGSLELRGALALVSGYDTPSGLLLMPVFNVRYKAVDALVFPEGITIGLAFNF